jgi:hypothetical protein
VKRLPTLRGKYLGPPGRQIHVDQDFHDKASGTSRSSARQAAYDSASNISSRSR